MLACATEPGASHRAVVAQQGGSLCVYDLATSRSVSKVPLELCVLRPAIQQSTSLSIMPSSIARCV